MVKVGELVPNMGLKSAENGGIMDERELRKKTNWVKGAKGYFAGSVSNGMGGRTRMTRSEYNNLCRHIITWLPNLPVGSIQHRYVSGDFYGFTVVEPGTYKFHLKIDGKNKQLIDKWRDADNE